MNSSGPVSVSMIVRAVFGAATVVSFVIALVVRDDPRWFALAGACATIWWVWGLLVQYAFAPTGDWLLRLLTGQLGADRAGDPRPSLDDTIRLLESHLERGASRKVEINAAIRLEEIYRTVR